MRRGPSQGGSGGAPSSRSISSRPAAVAARPISSCSRWVFCKRSIRSTRSAGASGNRERSTCAAACCSADTAPSCRPSRRARFHASQDCLCHLLHLRIRPRPQQLLFQPPLLAAESIIRLQRVQQQLLISRITDPSQDLVDQAQPQLHSPLALLSHPGSQRPPHRVVLRRVFLRRQLARPDAPVGDLVQRLPKEIERELPLLDPAAAGGSGRRPPSPPALLAAPPGAAARSCTRRRAGPCRHRWSSAAPDGPAPSDSDPRHPADPYRLTPDKRLTDQ